MSTGRPPIEPRYALRDHHGREVTETEFAGKYQLIFFGFTHCRAVCPRNLDKLSNVIAGLGATAEKIQPLYISVDPDRDTPAVMKAFLMEHYPLFLGLTGDQESTESARASFKVFAGRGQDPDDPEGYAVPHTAMTYLLDTEARYVTHFPEIVGPEQMATRLRELIL